MVIIFAALAWIGMCLSGCTVQLQKKRRPLVRIGHIESELGLKMERNIDKIKSSGNRRKGVSTIFEEELFLETEGDIYHPNLITFLAGLGVGFSQQEFRSNGNNNESRGRLINYRLNTRFLSKKSYPFSLHLSQTENLITRKFQGPMRSENKTIDVTGRLKIPDWPMFYSWTKSKLQQDATTANKNDLYRRNSERLTYGLRHAFSDRSDLSFKFEDSKVLQKGNSSSRADTTNYTLDHHLRFGEVAQHSLDTYINYMDKTGIFINKTFDWNETLSLIHLENFRTFYSLNFIQNKIGVFVSKSTTITAGFSHLLYESLLTNFSSLVTRTTIDPDVTIKRLENDLDLNYRKKNPWGELFGRYSVNVISSDSSGFTGTGVVIDESHVFNDPFAITLEQTNIDLTTIVVTDSTGFEVYSEGDDYTVMFVSGRVQLDVTPLGTDLPNIDDGQELLIDYTFAPDISTKTDSINHNFRLTQEFDNHWSLYYGYQRRDEKVSTSEDIDIIPNEFTTNIYGAAYEHDGLYLKAEHSRRDFTQNPTETTFLSGSYNWKISHDTSLTARGSQSWVKSGGDNPRDLTLFTTGVSLHTRLSNHVRIITKGEWRKRNDNVIGDTTGLRASSEVKFDYRLLNVAAGWEMNELDQRGTKTSSTLFYFRLQRRF